jgi:hypothetical protein
MSEKTGLNLKPFFDQYLRDVRIPILEYTVSGSDITYRWANCVQGFNMPLKVSVSGKEYLLSPSARWTTLKTEGTNPVLVPDPNFYATSFNLTGK